MRRILRFPMAMIDGLLQALQSLQTAINGKADAAHGHAITDVDGLPAALQGKANAEHDHAINDVSDLSDALAAKADLIDSVLDLAQMPDHGHPIEQISDLSDALASKASTSRKVSAGTGLSGGGDLSADRTLSVQFGTTSGTACAGDDARLEDPRPPTAHTHAQGEITGLQTALNDKEDAGTAAELLDSHTQASDPHPQYAMASEVENALETKADLIDGVLPTSQLPALAIVEFLGAIESEEEMLELIGQRGDWCIRTDVERAFFLTGDDPTDVDNWQQITTPGSPVLTVNGQTGEIVLSYGDVGAAAASHTHDIAAVSGLQTALDAKAATSRKVSAGTGLSGGGDLSADRTLSVQFGTTSGTACAGDDARLEDPRPPTAHTHSTTEITGLQTALDAKASLAGATFTGPMQVAATGSPNGFTPVTGTVASLSSTAATSSQCWLHLVAGNATFAGIYFGDPDSSTQGSLNYNNNGDVMTLRAGGVNRMSLTGVVAVLGNTFAIRTSRTIASAGASGNTGDICWDADFLYLCIATNTWRRIAHSSW